MAAIVEVKYFNTFLLKKVNANITSPNYGDIPVWNGSNGIPASKGGYPSSTNTDIGNNWVIEESRINGGYNNTTVSFGAKAYLVEEEPNSSIRGNSMIYSGIYNSRTGINRTNVFSVGEYLKDQFSENIVKKFPKLVRGIRGKGLMLGIEAIVNNEILIKQMINQKILVVKAGQNVIRMLPPLILEKKHVDEAIKKISKAFEKVNEEN